jgi:hypothetical protein
MLDLGFVDRPRDELAEWALRGPNRYRRQLAAMEVANWHLNEMGEENARKALKFIHIVVNSTSDRATRRRAAVMAAEAHRPLGQKGQAPDWTFPILETTAIGLRANRRHGLSA